ncbi:hypothetical protein LCGC14_0368060, partial [marine sediment metagenome]
MSDSKVDTEKLVSILDRLFVVPKNSEKRLSIAGLTDRQAKAMILFGQGKSISKIAREITNGSPFTQNAYDALGVGISKVFEALTGLLAIILAALGVKWRAGFLGLAKYHWNKGN